MEARATGVEVEDLLRALNRVARDGDALAGERQAPVRELGLDQGALGRIARAIALRKRLRARGIASGARPGAEAVAPERLRELEDGARIIVRRNPPSARAQAREGRKYRIHIRSI